VRDGVELGGQFAGTPHGGPTILAAGRGHRDKHRRSERGFISDIAAGRAAATSAAPA
jgi:hypothetical protein